MERPVTTNPYQPGGTRTREVIERQAMEDRRAMHADRLNRDTFTLTIIAAEAAKLRRDASDFEIARAERRIMKIVGAANAIDRARERLGITDNPVLINHIQRIGRVTQAGLEAIPHGHEGHCCLHGDACQA